MKTHQYRIHGIIRMISPLHIAAPGSVKYDPTTGTYPDKKDNGMPCTAVQQLNLPMLRSYKVNGDVKTFQAKVPLIAANNINGAFRRNCSAIVFDTMLAKNQQINMGTYSAMTCGAVTGNPDSAMVKFQEYREARANPFVGLFGGGPRMLRRHVWENNLVPYTSETEFMFRGAARHPSFDDIEKLDVMVPDGIRLVQQFHFLRNDDLLKFVDLAMQEKVIKDFEKNMLERQNNILQAQGNKGEEGTSKANKFSPRTMSAYEFVIPGIAFPLSLELDVTDDQLGLFLLTLDRFAEKERIGGMVRNGFGQFVLENVVLVDGETGEVKKHLFSGGRLNRDDSGAAYPYLQAWHLAAQSPEFSAERLDYLMRLPAPKATDEEKKEKAAAKKAAKEAAGA